MNELHTLRRLARLHGVQTDYCDNSQRQCHASPQALLRVLQAWGAPLNGMAEVPAALRQRRHELCQQVAPPVVVAWDGDGSVRLRLPERASAGQQSPARIDCRLTCEDGDEREWMVQVDNLPVRRRRSVEGVAYVERRLALPPGLSLGYHTLMLAWPGRTAETLVISSPRQGYVATWDKKWRPAWGVFLPLYALHRESSWGGGDLSDLQELARWTAGRGGRFVATLPLLAWQYELNDDPSPYAPSSRLFWNDFYVDVTQIPDFAACEPAKALVSSTAFQQELSALRGEPAVDYVRQMRLKRQVLETLADHCFSHAGDRRGELKAFCRDHPDAEAFARFRAVSEREGRCWLDWPEPLRSGTLSPGDYDECVARCHLYVQWQVQRQLEALADDTRANDLLWYLDYPLGVSRGGFDAWQQRQVFVMDANGGAPPDSFFTKGQNWGFPPLHPQGLREQRYRYFIASLRRHLRCARLLRIDHVMGMHRLYWVPEGLAATDGAYVRYPAEELFAILTLESHRHQAQIVGENLGTVPPAVDRSLDRHGVHGMYVLQYEIRPAWPPMREPPAATVASLNTHDMPTFLAFWNAGDVADRLDLGLLSPAEADAERHARAALRGNLVSYLANAGLLPHGTQEPEKVLGALLAWLGSSSANFVLANLEDLWGEAQPQNTPGTWQERVNWRRKARYTFEQFRDLPPVAAALAKLEQARREAAARSTAYPPPHYLPHGAAVPRGS